MRILFIGDVFGNAGRRILAENLKNVLTDNAIDLCIANGENIAGGRGITRPMVKKLHKYGVQIITGGNHSFAHPEVFSDTPPLRHLLRPLNIMDKSGGVGTTMFEFPDGRQVAVINLIGRTFMNENYGCPFVMGAQAIEEATRLTHSIIIDFHAEASSEKICLATYFDGKVSAVIGTHTHVQTADERILPKGTGFITDAGMTGPEDSAIGMKYEAVIDRYTTQMKKPFEQATRGPMMNALILDIDETTGKTIAIKRLYQRYTFDA